MQKRRKVGTSASALILLCWLVYTCSYIGKANYSANINPIMEFYKVDHSTAGLVSTVFFFAYGVGQVINGLFCKKYNLKWIVFISLIISGSINLIVGISNDFTPIKYLWLINGFAMSILWPSLICLLSETLAKKDMAKASIMMGTTVAAGTFLVYILSALFVKISFRLSFYLPAGLFLVVALIWLFTFSPIVNKAKAEEIMEEDIALTKDKQENFTHFLLMLSIVMLCFYGIAVNLIKDGLTTWVPSILKEEYELDDSLSIILTLVLPTVAIYGNIFAIGMHKKLPDFVLQCALMFLISGAILGGIIAGIMLKQVVITLIGSTLVCFLVSSCNSLITSIFPLFMKWKINSGKIAGILNGFCYLGSMISSYGLGAIADNFGWIMFFWVLLFVCVGACVSACVYFFIKKSLKEQ